MGCSSCGGGGGVPVSTREVVYTDPKGVQHVVESETEAKIQVSINGGGSYTVRAKK